MSEIKMKFKVSHTPDDVPGTWKKSKLKLFLKGDRFFIERMEKVIMSVLEQKE